MPFSFGSFENRKQMARMPAGAVAILARGPQAT
ncbi:hypothetical protein GGR24_000475 [Hansschlegelia beijingensis]|uniref:Uncharacterized protein n=1 Tax=Hansschlegelia beijingensis TaxID=1133344 RepID=A0A7W6CX27_9HYPH|nr:hypothetical protein [Hansschlegelia beijingensis]